MTVLKNQEGRVEIGAYENFPAWIVLLSNGVAISIYILGAYILGRGGILFEILSFLVGKRPDEEGDKSASKSMCEV